MAVFYDSIVMSFHCTHAAVIPYVKNCIHVTETGKHLEVKGWMGMG